MSIGATESLLASAGAISDPTAAQRPALQVWLRAQASGETQGVGREAHDETDRAPTKMKPKGLALPKLIVKPRWPMRLRTGRLCSGSRAESALRGAPARSA